MMIECGRIGHVVVAIAILLASVFGGTTARSDISDTPLIGELLDATPTSEAHFQTLFSWPFDTLGPSDPVPVVSPVLADPIRLLDRFNIGEEFRSTFLRAIVGYAPRRGPLGVVAHAGPEGLQAAVAVYRGSPGRRRVALTFDACADFRRPRLDEGVVDVLERLRVPATIFVSGSWAERAPALVQRLAESDLFEIGNHSFFHPHLTRVSGLRLIEELQWTQDVLFNLTGRVPVLFRPPFGEVDGRVLETAAVLGLRTIQFDVESGDPDPHITPDRMSAWVARQIRSGSIVVMHVNGRGRSTAEALPRIVRDLRGRGYELVRVSALLDG